MDLNNVRLFVDVVNAGSFAAAAAKHNLDPSSVSRSIANLEKQLNFRLFQRSTRRIAITESGQLYYDEIAPLLKQFEQAAEKARDLVQEAKGHLRIAACTSFGQRMLAPLLPKLRQQYPEISIELVLSDQEINLLEENIDLAIRFGNRPDCDMQVTHFFPRNFKVCASPDYLAKTEQTTPLKKPQDLSQHSCIIFHLPGYRSAWRFRKTGEGDFRVPINGHLQISHGQTMTECAVNGLGPAIIPDWLCDTEIAEGKLCDVFPDYECAPREFGTAAWLVQPARDYIPLSLSVFLEFLHQELGTSNGSNSSK